MTKAIAELWYGNIDPSKRLGRNNTEIKQLEHLMQRHLTKIEESLSEKQMDIFGKYHDCIGEYISIICEQAFCDGYCMGTKLSVEAMTGAEQMI